MAYEKFPEPDILTQSEQQILSILAVCGPGDQKVEQMMRTELGRRTEWLRGLMRDLILRCPEPTQTDIRLVINTAKPSGFSSEQIQYVDWEMVVRVMADLNLVYYKRVGQEYKFMPRQRVVTLRSHGVRDIPLTHPYIYYPLERMDEVRAYGEDVEAGRLPQPPKEYWADCSSPPTRPKGKGKRSGLKERH